MWAGDMGAVFVAIPSLECLSLVCSLVTSSEVKLSFLLCYSWMRAHAAFLRGMCGSDWLRRTRGRRRSTSTGCRTWRSVACGIELGAAGYKSDDRGKLCTTFFEEYFDYVHVIFFATR